MFFCRIHSNGGSLRVEKHKNLWGPEGSCLPHVEGQRGAIGQPQEQKGAAANAARRRTDDSQAQRRRHGGVHGVPTFAEEVPPDPRAPAVVGGHRAMLGREDLSPSSNGPSMAELQQQEQE